MSYGTLFLLVASGIVGPLLAGLRGLAIPMIFGEIAAGVVIGKTGFNCLPTGDPTVGFLSMVGLAMLQFLVGMRLPLRDANLHNDVKQGLIATTLVCILSVPLGMLFANWAGFGHWSMFAVMFAASSAAIVMPIIYEMKLSGEMLLRTISWVVLADITSVIAMSVAMSTGSTLTAIFGSLLVVAAAAGASVLLKWFFKQEIGDYYRHLSWEKAWALDLRLSLLLLLGLCWLAQSFGVSILIAGFAAGAVVSILDMPSRLTKQLMGLGEGFFVPLFFVDLGAQLDFRALCSPDLFALAILLWLATLAIHLLVSKLVHLPASAGLIATAQKGVSAAIVSLGLASGALNSGQGAAIILAMLLALITCSVGAGMMAKTEVEQPQGMILPQQTQTNVASSVEVYDDGDD